MKAKVKHATAWASTGGWTDEAFQVGIIYDILLPGERGAVFIYRQVYR